MKFTELKLNNKILEAIDYMGFEETTPIQEKSIPSILNGQDLIACAQTGTGKTAAFVIPILHKIIINKPIGINTLIIVPTRELALQIDQQIEGFAYFVSVGSIAIYGGGDGQDWETQKDALKKGVNIVVATPGKLLSHLKQNYVDFSKIEHLILDEADRMLDMGFYEDIRQIISYLPKNRQTLLFSATMPKSIENLANSILINPAKFSLNLSKPASGVKQTAYYCYENQKIKLLIHILNLHPDFDSILIFTSTKANVSNIVSNLRQKGIYSQGISSNLNQDEREEILRKFRARRISVLVATDVMSRGIDVKEINMVVNYDVPEDAEDYVHRVGRTARLETIGEAITLVNTEDIQKIRKIEALIESKIPKEYTPDEIGKAPNIDEYSNTNRKKGKKPFRNKFRNKKHNKHSNRKESN
ncbi:MAG TPA: DEAD/DEAH box helicase [Bacteroidales bacterium]|nr:DEAD/DEAH box helicase [Bacteroidales bacterium]